MSSAGSQMAQKMGASSAKGHTNAALDIPRGAKLRDEHSLSTMVQHHMLGLIDRSNNILYKTARLRGVLFNEGENVKDSDADGGHYGGLLDQLNTNINTVFANLEKAELELNRIVNAIEGQGSVADVAGSDSLS